MIFKITSYMENNKKKVKKELNPVVIMGNKAFTLSNFSDNNPEVMVAINEWAAKKEKALERAEKRKLKNRLKR